MRDHPSLLAGHRLLDLERILKALHTIYNWEAESFSYLRIPKCYSSTFTNYFNDRDGSSVIGTHANGQMRVAFIRHPLQRVVSFYSRTWHQKPFEQWVRSDLPGLIERDPHAAKYWKIRALATHVEAVEAMNVWWPVYQELKPQFFGDMPTQTANASKDHHKPDQSLVNELAPLIMRNYREDEDLWLEKYETALRSYP